MTPHIKAKKEDVANVVVMPGDPLRAKWIAETFLKEPKLINEVRGMLGYTGLYEGKRVTVMGHGMGIPSIGIYSYELFKFYDVKAIIRVGSAGSYKEEVKVKDIFIGTSSFSESTYADMIKVKHDNNVLMANEDLVEIALEESKSITDVAVHQGRVHAADAFYNDFTVQENSERSGADVVEMEAFALYANAEKLGRQALCLLTVSDSLVTHESMSPEDRQTKFGVMAKLGLDIAKRVA